MSNDPRETRVCRVLAALLILLGAGLHIAYLAQAGALDLSPDEAHYWVWSRHLDWSYYSKGPLVAYLIRLGTAVAGDWSCAWTATAMPAVRLPAIVCGSLLLVALYVLTVQVYRRERLALGVVALALTLPVIAAGSSIMTIDAPYTFFWGWALVVGYHACFRRAAWAWPVAGLLVGLGILAKYTMVVWLPSLGLFLLFDRERRALLFRPGFWVMVATAAVCCVPIVVWNAQHDWVTVRHVFVQAGVQGPKGVKLLGPLRFLGMQFGLLIGFWFVTWAIAMFAKRPSKEADPGVRYLWWMSAPMFAMFLIFSIRTNGGEPNWPVTAYISGLVLAAAWLGEQYYSSNRAWRNLSYGTTAVAGVFGIALIVLMHFSTLAQPLLKAVSGPETAERPLPLRRFDPSCRLRGWRYLAAEVDRIRSQVREEEGEEPIVAGCAWTVPGELEFYCEGHPTVYTLGLALGDRWSQFDIWRPNPVQDPERFRGKTFVVVGNRCDLLERGFASGEIKQHPVWYREQGEPVAAWVILVCKGFQKMEIPVAPPR